MNLSRDELLSKLRKVDEYEFEHLVADVWEQRGWQTYVTSGSSDRGIDVVAKKNRPFGQKYLIQAKRYSAGNKIGSPDIQQYSSLRHQESEVDAVVVVTTSSFTTQAQQTANDLNVKLINGADLCDMILDLRSREFISKYIYIDEDEGESNSGSITESGSATGYDEPEGDTNPRRSGLPDRFQKQEKTTKFGRHCPICGAVNSVWKVKTVNSGVLLVCEKCETKWMKKSGIIASTKWKALGMDMKKTASKWKEMNLHKSE